MVDSKMCVRIWFLLFFLTVGCYANDQGQNIDNGTVLSQLNDLINQLKSQEATPDCSSNLELSILLHCLVNRLRCLGGAPNKTTMYWSEARSFCRSKGMDLVAIESEAENAALSEHGKTLGFFSPYNGAWTSGCYNNYHGKFIWHSTGKPLSYTKWWPDYPKKANSNEGYCIIYYPPDPRWWEVPISLNLPVICEL
ncbi:hypothetical protein B566_EDAN017880 [Ephemera danica]|nr:hypothetical protein B566_EDAN017880 [Ephemera danica]